MDVCLALCSCFDDRHCWKSWKKMYSDSEGLPPDQIVPTVGLNIGCAKELNTKLVFWDLGGQVCIES